MAGAGYKLFNTGDVLTAAQVNTYLMEQTVMVFADAAARTTALSGVVSEGMISYLKDTNAVEVYDGSNWVSSDDPNAIQNSIINAKGDLIVGSANDTPSILSISSDGSTLVADSSTSTGLRYQAGNGLAQGAINGAFDIWQRGTSFAAPNYTADRWYAIGGNTTYAQESTAANLPTGFLYGMKMTMSGTDVPLFAQAIETANAIYYAGKRVVLSCYMSTTGSTAGLIRLDYSDSADVAIGGTWTTLSAVSGYSTTPSTTTTMARYYAVFDVPSTAQSLRILIGSSVNMTSSSIMRVTGVQLEVGSVPTEFRRAGGNIAGELAACQRYYYRATSTASFQMLSNFGTGKGTTQAIISLKCPATMRVTPTAVDYANIAIYDYTNAAIAITSMAIETYASPFEPFLTATVASGVTVYRPYAIISNSTVGAYIGVSAEL